MTKKKILITGAGGFIGSHLAQTLHNKGQYVRVVDIKWGGYLEEPYYSEKFTLDLTNVHNCLKATENIEYVYNLAANMGGIGFISEVGAQVMHDNSLININMLEASVKNKVKRFFLSSSACVYPEDRQKNTNVIPLKESDAYPAHPDTPYGWEKLYAEQLCATYTKDHGIETRIARYHNIFGPAGTFSGGREKAPAALCRKVCESTNPGLIKIWGDGKQTRSYCYIDDCVEGTIALMESNYMEPINIGSDRLLTVDELADIIIQISGKKIEKTYEISAPQGVRGRNADLTLTKHVLDWEPHVTIEKGLEKTYTWIKKQLNSLKHV